MPVASGERMSVAITTFLSFIVYLEMINENVPPSSSPMAYLYFYVLFLLVYSSMTMFLCIVSMIIHDKQGPVPETLKTIVIYLRFWCCRKSHRTDLRLRKVSPDEHNANVKNFPEFSETENLPDVMSTDTDNVPAVTWTVVGETHLRIVFIQEYEGCLCVYARQWRKLSELLRETIEMTSFERADTICSIATNARKHLEKARKSCCIDASESQQLDVVDRHFLDGLYFDFEGPILPDQFDLRDGYTALVRETRATLVQKFPFAMVSVDVGWGVQGVDERNYDYQVLVAAADFLFVMAYDMQNQIRGSCVAGANSPFPRENVCSIRAIPFRGVYCSDAAGNEIKFNTISSLLESSTSGRLWDEESQTPYFNYEYAVDAGLRGVGVWNTEALVYSSQTPRDIWDVHEMWTALPDFHHNQPRNHRKQSTRHKLLKK
ncbi:DIAC-like protein [Mya arenaria]|uniref:DIAC-like protein n=1 Tax=Mya arenaria TaxID=6604 RepID=A0ABY7FV69_MYAAR|nr:DIAC-like protein [Mya arenaria]